MPVPDELIESIKEQDTDELADALKDKAHDHYQKIFQRGYSTSHNEAKDKLSTKDAKLQALQEEVEQKEQALEAAKKEGAGDEELKSKIKSLEESNQKLKAQAEAAEEARANAAKGYHRDALREQIVSKLVEKGVEPDYAREVMAPKVARRIDVREQEEDGEKRYRPRFMDGDGVTPLQATNESLADVAADNLIAGVDDKWKVSRADSGGGAQNGSRGGAGSSKFDRQRQDVEKKYGQEASSEEKAKRLGL